MKVKKWLAASLSAGLLLNILSGCGAQAAASPSPSAAAAAPTAGAAPYQNGAGGDKQDGAVQGIVTAIDGDTITVRTMGRGFGGKDGGPDRGSMDGGGLVQETPQQAAPSQTPDTASADADESSGAAPDGQDGMTQEQQGARRSAPAGEEELTITLSSDIKISILDNGASSAGTAENLAVGCMIGITYGEDGQTVTEIAVSFAGEVPREEQQQQ